MTLIIMKITNKLYFRLSISLSLSEAFSWLDSGYVSGQKYGSDALFLSLHLTKWHMIAIGPIAGDVNFDHLIKAASARLLHYKVTLFPPPPL